MTGSPFTSFLQSKVKSARSWDVHLNFTLENLRRCCSKSPTRWSWGGSSSSGTSGKLSTKNNPTHANCPRRMRHNQEPSSPSPSNPSTSSPSLRGSTVSCASRNASRFSNGKFSLPSYPTSPSHKDSTSSLTKLKARLISRKSAPLNDWFRRRESRDDFGNRWSKIYIWDHPRAATPLPDIVPWATAAGQAACAAFRNVDTGQEVMGIPYTDMDMMYDEVAEIAGPAGVIRIGVREVLSRERLHDSYLQDAPVRKRAGTGDYAVGTGEVGAVGCSFSWLSWGSSPQLTRVWTPTKSSHTRM